MIQKRFNPKQEQGRAQEFIQFEKNWLHLRCFFPRTFDLVAPHCVISLWISAARNYGSWTTTLGAEPDAGEIEKDGYTRTNYKNNCT